MRSLVLALFTLSDLTPIYADSTTTILMTATATDTCETQTDTLRERLMPYGININAIQCREAAQNRLRKFEVSYVQEDAQSFLVQSSHRQALPIVRGVSPNLSLAECESDLEEISMAYATNTGVNPLWGECINVSTGDPVYLPYIVGYGNFNRYHQSEVLLNLPDGVTEQQALEQYIQSLRHADGVVQTISEVEVDAAGQTLTGPYVSFFSPSYVPASTEDWGFDRVLGYCDNEINYLKSAFAGRRESLPLLFCGQVGQSERLYSFGDRNYSYEFVIHDWYERYVQSYDQCTKNRKFFIDAYEDRFPARKAIAVICSYVHLISGGRETKDYRPVVLFERN